MENSKPIKKVIKYSTEELLNQLNEEKKKWESSIRVNTISKPAEEDQGLLPNNNIINKCVCFLCKNKDLRIDSKNVTTSQISMLNCMLINIRSLTKEKINMLINDFFDEEQIHICCVTETWLKPSDHALIAELNVRGYQILNCFRTLKKGSSIALICPINYKCKKLKPKIVITLKY